MLFDELLKAAAPDPVTCMGVPLRPFSLGALLLLQRFDNAFLIHSELKAESFLPQDLDAVLPLGDLLQGIVRQD